MRGHTICVVCYFLQYKEAAAVSLPGSAPIQQTKNNSCLKYHLSHEYFSVTGTLLSSRNLGALLPLGLSDYCIKIHLTADNDFFLRERKVTKTCSVERPSERKPQREENFMLGNCLFLVFQKE